MATSAALSQGVDVADNGGVLIKQHQSARAFLRKVGPLFYADEAAHSLMLGLCESLVRVQETKPPPLFFRVEHDGETIGAALQTPPHNLILTKMPSADLKDLAAFLFSREIELPGLIGPPREVSAFARIWMKKTGAALAQTIEQRLYRLNAVIPPADSEGSVHPAEPRHVGLLARWLRDFAAETLPFEQRSLSLHKAQVQMKIEQGQAFVWRVGRSPVAMAFTTRPTRNGMSIGPVFTPSKERKKGYASALVAALSQHVLESGKKFCVLYTDLSNPTSNKIYTTIGYEPIADSRYVIFKKARSDV